MAHPTSSNKSLVFKVTRHAPELIPPAAPTPNEFKELSDIDDQDGFRFQIPVIQFYKNNNEHYGGSTLRGRDPAIVIKEAVAKALVPYYPFAGRLREKAGRKLVVECTGEGIMFIEADADVQLKDFGEALQPPFPCLEELIYDVPGSNGVLDCPLILMQVTRLKCGGFILALRLNHTMADAAGLVQFMNAMAELARGAHFPSIPSIWERHLLCARDPPRVTCVHHEYAEVTDTTNTNNHVDDMVSKSFFFGHNEMAVLRRFVPPHLKSTSTYEVLAACLWRCRTIAIQPKPQDLVRFVCLVNFRSKLNPPLPNGYYGNAFALAMAFTTAEKLCKKPMGYAIELVKKAKKNITEEYVKSTVDLMVIKNRPQFTAVRTFIISDVTRAGFADLDFGWGLPTFGGPAKELNDAITFSIPCKNSKGENGIVIPICLPGLAMERFTKELHKMLLHPFHENLYTSFFKVKLHKL